MANFALVKDSKNYDNVRSMLSPFSFKKSQKSRLKRDTSRTVLFKSFLIDEESPFFETLIMLDRKQVSFKTSQHLFSNLKSKVEVQSLLLVNSRAELPKYLVSVNFCREISAASHFESKKHSTRMLQQFLTQKCSL